MPRLVCSSEFVVGRRKSTHHPLPTIYCKVKRGFTLIELMVVITIIAIIMSIAYISFATAQNKGRDAKRKQDLKAIRSALTAYYRDKGFYPPNPASASQYASDNVNGGEWIAGLVTPLSYMQSIPADPGQGILSGTATCSGKTHIYCYTVAANGTDYALWAQLDNTQDSEAINQPNSTCNQNPANWGGMGGIPTTFNYCVQSQQ